MCCQLTKPWKTAIGIVFILCVVVLWVGSSFFVKYVVFGDVLNISNGNMSEDGYDIPYYLTYLCNSLFIVYLPIVGVKNAVVKAASSKERGKVNQQVATTTGLVVQEDDTLSRAKLLQDPTNTAVTETGATPSNSVKPHSVLKHTVKWALIVSPFWFAANCTYNVSQGMTSVTSNSIISSTSGWLGTHDVHFHHHPPS